GRPAQAPEAVLRLDRDRRRCARALQPAGRGPRRRPDRRAAERRQRAAGRRFPVRGGGLDAGDHPVLRARRRAARALPLHVQAAGAGRDGRGGGVNNSLLVVLIASGIAYGTPLLYASLGELLTERAGVLNLGVE